jgi:2-phosphosulfolactate phosphatase
VALLPSCLPPGLVLAETCAVVVDVLRATTVMTTAGAAGAALLHTCESTEQARRWAGQLEGRGLLCGERQCKPIAGFDLGNSPAEYTPPVVGGRELILTTTNGTRAVRAVAEAGRMLVASFLNLRSTLETLRGEPRVLVVCAGTEGEVSYEDVLLAGALTAGLTAGESSADASPSRQLDDTARLARDAWRQTRATAPTTETAVAEALRHSRGGRNLIAAGYQADIERCSRIDAVPGLVERRRGSRATFAFQPGGDGPRGAV